MDVDDEDGTPGAALGVCGRDSKRTKGASGTVVVPLGPLTVSIPFPGTKVTEAGWGTGTEPTWDAERVLVANARKTGLSIEYGRGNRSGA